VYYLYVRITVDEEYIIN